MCFMSRLTTCWCVPLVSSLEFHQRGSVTPSSWRWRTTINSLSFQPCSSRAYARTCDLRRLKCESCQSATLRLVEGSGAPSADTHGDGGARRVGPVARRGQRRQRPPPTLGSEKNPPNTRDYVRPLALGESPYITNDSAVGARVSAWVLFQITD